MSVTTHFNRIRESIRIANDRFDAIEERYSLSALRYSLAIVFVWFGIIKPLGMTPATMLVRETLAATPILRAIVSFPVFMSVLGWWEALVGLGLFYRGTIRIAVVCMMVQMASTFVPLAVVPGVTFHSSPFVPTTAGLYIIKNFVLLTAGLVVASMYGGTSLFGEKLTSRFIQFFTERRRDASVLRTLKGRQQSNLHLLRGGLCLVFLWSGLLTLTGSAELGSWIANVVQPFTPHPVLVPLVGALELAIGLYLFTNRTTHLAAYLAVVYLVLTQLPLLAQPASTFNTSLAALSFKGAYLVKDWILVSAVFVVDYHELEL